MVVSILLREGILGVVIDVPDDLFEMDVVVSVGILSNFLLFSVILPGSLSAWRKQRSLVISVLLRKGILGVVMDVPDDLVEMGVVAP